MLNLYSKAQMMTTIAGTGAGYYDSGDSGLATLAIINEPTGIAINKKGEIIISENFNGIRKIDKNGIITSPGPIYSSPILIIDSSGNLFIPTGNLIRKIDTSYIVTVIAGGGTKISNGIPATQCLLNKPTGLTFDKKHNLYIGDQFRISKVDVNGNISTIAGTIGMLGYYGDSGKAVDALISYPQSMIFDNNGNLYIADLGNNIIRKIDTSGMITTFAGTGSAGFSGDNGLAIDATFIQPSGLAFDSYGNLYIADQGNNRIRKVDTSGIITTYAGTGNTGNQNGPALQATMYAPTGLFIDSANNLYIADYGNNLIRKVSPPVLPVTLLSFSVSGFKSFNGNTNTAVKWETASEINVSHFNVQRSEDGVIFETLGTVKAKGAGSYSFKDNSNLSGVVYYRLEIVDNNGAISYSDIKEISINHSPLSITPIPAKDYVTVDGSNIRQVIISDMSGRVLIRTTEKKINISSLMNGVYMVIIETNDGNRVVEKMVKM